MNIREERPGDVREIRGVNEQAFDTSLEADLVDALRAEAAPLISLVAEEPGTIVGHIMFSPVTLGSRRAAKTSVRIAGLAPMAVLPARQRHGIGSALVRAGLVECRRLGFEAVVVLGHPAYYPRFGFTSASRFGVASEYDVPDEAFMALELVDGALAGSAGTIRYHPAFARVAP